MGGVLGNRLGRGLERGPRRDEVLATKTYLAMFSFTWLATSILKKARHQVNVKCGDLFIYFISGSRKPQLN